MNGCPYGLGSVVVTFNRYPTLATAMFRRCLGLISAAYFDDNLLVDIASSAQKAKNMLTWAFARGLGHAAEGGKGFPDAVASSLPWRCT